MDLLEKKNELIILIFDHCENRTSLEDLQKFAWDIIDYFNKSKKTDLPIYQKFENELWYTIWQIQHLADEEHENDGVTKKTLLEALDYLKGNKEFPKTCSGTRP